MALTRPTPFLSKWAENGKRFDVPDTGGDTANGKADMQTGFPEITMRSVLKGGVPPWGQDHNGILYQITQSIQWMQAGGLETFDQDLCNKTGGYPVGAIVQSSDTTKPWVLWQNLQDGNAVDPNGLKINNASEQSGWRRYPAIEAKDGATLYYNDAGELAIFTAQNTSVKYVSWSTGNDTTGDGTRKNPYKTIDKAITVSPSSGQITIKILDVDDHYIVGMNDAVTKDPSQYTPGPVYTASDNITQEPTETISTSINVGIRSVIIEPYNNPDGKTDGPDGWEELINLAQVNTGDGWWGYCVDDDALTSRGLRRPVLYKLWCYLYIRDNGKWITSSLRYCGFNGIEGSFSVGFLGCKLANYNLDALNNAPFVMASAFEENGGSYIYNGCIIDLLCTPSTYNKYSMGGTEITSSTLSFRRNNVFVNEQQNTAGLFIGVGGKLTLTITADGSGTLPSTSYNYITSNVNSFLSKSSSYTTGTLTQIAKPSPHYAYLDTNILIT
ncbi:hypothetical protein COMNV_00961 [Commensalibacter sp. Nvir]|uniref:hypothetical protein n=1 Tax=Commensalibacter sp. Nvir TaxID=3069817 RepID=UPI002D441A55|nr:hypothetical protein COMNV_00961 [Commensalibacter sp. Nvir]